MFDFLFRRKKETTPAAPAQGDPFDAPIDGEVEGSPYIIKRLDSGMPIEILGEDSSTLCRGRILEENNLRLVIGRLPGDMALAVLPQGSTVTFTAYNRDTEYVRVTATVIESSIMKLYLRDWDLEENISKRRAKRFPLDIEAKLFALEDTKLKRARECRIRDLSETGARVTTNANIEVGEAIRLQLEIFPGDGRIFLPGQVVWCSMLEVNSKEFGVVFAELDNRKVRDLRASLSVVKEKIMRATKK